MTKHPVTMAVRALRAAKVSFAPHTYAWHPHGGTDRLEVPEFLPRR